MKRWYPTDKAGGSHICWAVHNTCFHILVIQMDGGELLTLGRIVPPLYILVAPPEHLQDGDSALRMGETLNTGINTRVTGQPEG